MATAIGGLPVGSVTTSGGTATVSHLLNNPRIIEQRIAEAAPLNYFADLILPNLGQSSAGVVIYEEWTPESWTMSRKAEELAPDSEVPLAGVSDGDVKMERVKIDGLGYTVTREQESRNQRWVVDRKERALANEISDKFNSRAIDVVDKAIAAKSRTMAATDWSALVTDGGNPDPNAEWPHSTIALVRANQQADRIPFLYDSMIAHPLDIWRLLTIYKDIQGAGGMPQQLAALASKLGLNTVLADNTGIVDRGEPILWSQGNVGGTVWEEPITVEVIPEPRRRRKAVQSTGGAAMFVDNAYGLLKLTGVADDDLDTP